VKEKTIQKLLVKSTKSIVSTPVFGLLKKLGVGGEFEGTGDG